MTPPCWTLTPTARPGASATTIFAATTRTRRAWRNWRRCVAPSPPSLKTYRQRLCPAWQRSAAWRPAQPLWRLPKTGWPKKPTLCAAACPVRLLSASPVRLICKRCPPRCCPASSKPRAWATTAKARCAWPSAPNWPPPGRSCSSSPACWKNCCRWRWNARCCWPGALTGRWCISRCSAICTATASWPSPRCMQAVCRPRWPRRRWLRRKR